MTYTFPSGAATTVQMAGYLVALRAKGETPAEIAGMASALLAHARRVRLTERAVDIVGGRDRRSELSTLCPELSISWEVEKPSLEHSKPNIE